MNSRIVISIVVLTALLPGVRSVAASEAVRASLSCEDATIVAMDSTDTAIDQLLAFEEIAPDCTGTGVFEAGLGNAYIYSGRPEEAERLIRDALAQGLEYEKQLTGVLGDALFRQEKFEEAEALARALIEEHPDFYIGYWRLGDVLLVTGDYEGVVSAMETANEIEENSVSYQLLTMAHFKLENYLESAQSLQISLRMDPAGLRHTNTIASGALSLLRLGHYEAGRELLNKHFELVPEAILEPNFQTALRHYERAAQE